MSLVGKSAEYFSSYDPRHVPGCILWLDGNDPQAYTAEVSGSTLRVTQWQDKSSNAHVFTRMSTNYPIVSNFASNGLSALYLGTNAGMRNTSVAFPSNYSAFVVASRSESNGSYGYVYKVNSSVDGHGFFGVNNLNSFATFVGNGVTTWWDVNSNAPNRPMTQVPELLGVDVCGTLFPYWNGLQLTPKTGITVNTTGLIVGTAVDGSQPWLGHIGEILVFSNRLTPEYRQEIEGYLMWKWKLCRTEPNSLWRTGTADPLTFTPTSIGGLAAWLDASDTATITTATMSGTTLVANWTDKSGAARPTIWRTSNPSYDPVTRSIVLTGGSFLISGCDSRKTTTPNFNVFMVYRWLEGGLSSELRNSVLWGSDGGGGNNRWQILGFPAAPVLTQALNRGGTDPTFIPGTSLDTPAQIVYSSCHSLSQANGSFFRVNGYESSYRGTEVAAVPQTAMTSTSIGNLDEGNTYPARIAINEILIYRTSLTDASRANVETYLATKWNIPWFTPIVRGHPYSNDPIVQRSFLPTDLSTTGLWFDAGSPTTVSGTTSVTGWRSKGTLPTAAVTALGTAVAYQTDATQRSFLRFTPGNDLRFTVALNTQARSWFFVSRINTELTGPYGTFFSPMNATGTTNQNAIYFTRVTATTWDLLSGTSGSADLVAASIPNPFNRVGVYSLVNSTIAAQNAIAVDGSGLPLTASGAASGYVTTSLPYEIGTGRSPYVGGDMFEMLFYPRTLSSNERQRVEGYLAWRWNVQSNLPIAHPFSRFYPLIGQFGPTQLSNCVLWLDAVDSNSMEFTPGTRNIRVWRNKAPGGDTTGTVFGYDASSSGTSSLLDGGLGTLPAVRFTGSNWFRGVTRVASTSEMTQYLVFTADVSASALNRWMIVSGAFAGAGSYTDGSGTLFGMLNDTVNNIRVARGAVQTGASFTAPTPTIAGAIFNGTTGRVFVNGTPGSDGSGSTGPFNLSEYTIGALPVGTSNAHVGTIGEVLLYSRALSEWERQRVEGYLAGKWGLQSRLPTTHQYRDLMP